MRSRLVAAIAVAAGVGFAVGSLRFREERVQPAVEPCPVVAPTPVAAAPTPPPPAPAPAASAPPSKPVAAVDPAELPDILATVETLENRLSELERQLSTERSLRRNFEGDRIEVPPNLPPRFRDDALLVSSFNAAFKAAGFQAQVTSVDCSEHPCLVFGTGFGERGDLEKIKGSLGQYQRDSFSTFGFGSPDGKSENRFFGVAVMPSQKGPPDEAFSKRVTFRVNQMHEASKPKP